MEVRLAPTIHLIRYGGLNLTSSNAISKRQQEYKTGLSFESGFNINHLNNCGIPLIREYPPIRAIAMTVITPTTVSHIGCL